MMAEHEKYEVFENFLKGDLSNDEKIEFENRLKDDPDLRSEFVQHEQLYGVISDKGFLDIKDSIKDIHVNRLGFQKRVRFWGVSSVVVITVVASILIRWGNAGKPDDGSIIEPAKVETTGPEEHENIQVPKKPEEKERKEKPQIQRAEINRNQQEGPLQIHTETNNNVLNNKMNTPELPPVKIENNMETGASTGNPVVPDKGPEKGTVPVNENVGPDCEDVEIYAQIEKTSSCNNKPTGSLSFLSGTVQGGRPPFKFSIDNGGTFQQANEFKNIKAGLYRLMIMDVDNCKTSLGPYRVEMKDCTYEEAFAPASGELWELPVEDKNSKLVIFSKTGNIVFTRNIDAFEKYEWDGRNANNEMLPMGMYRFIIQFDDTSEITGYITIIR